MGMTIDDHIEVLKSYHNGFTGQAGNLQESIDVVIETMKKYQKIEQILHNGFGKGVYAVFDEIVKVVEDGQNTIKD